MRSSPIRAEEQAWRNCGAGEGYGKYEATPQKSVEGNKGLNYPPHPFWSLTLLGKTSKLTQWRRYKVNSGKSKAVISVGILPSPPVPCGHPRSLLKLLHLHIWGLVIISWCRSLGARKAGANSLLMGCHSIPTGLACYAPGCLYGEKNGSWVALRVLWGQEESKATFFCTIEWGQDLENKSLSSGSMKGSWVFWITEKHTSWILRKKK